MTRTAGPTLAGEEAEPTTEEVQEGNLWAAAEAAEVTSRVEGEARRNSVPETPCWPAALL